MRRGKVTPGVSLQLHEYMWKSGSKDSRILNLGTRWICVISFTLWPLYSLKNSQVLTPVPIWTRWRREIFAPVVNRIPVQPVASHFTDLAIPAHVNSITV